MIIPTVRRGQNFQKCALTFFVRHPAKYKVHCSLSNFQRKPCPFFIGISCLPLPFGPRPGPGFKGFICIRSADDSAEDRNRYGQPPVPPPVRQVYWSAQNPVLKYFISHWYSEFSWSGFGWKKKLEIHISTIKPTITCSIEKG